MKPKVFVSRIIPDAGLKRLQVVCEVDLWEEPLPPDYDTLLEHVRGVDGILCMLTERIDGQLMDAAGPQIKVISQMAVGYDNIDVSAASERGIPVGNTPGVLTEATADLTLALLLASARRIVEGMQYIQDGKWQTWEPMGLLGADLTGATLGIIGMGRIGAAVAQRAAAFDMKIAAYSPSLTREQARNAGVEKVDLESLLSDSDFISIHCPLNDQTRGLIDAETLAQMKESAILINTARGPIVNQADLYEALKNGVIRAAALDVTDPEPISMDDPLLTLPNIIIVPHIGSASVRTRDRMAQMAASNLLAGLEGKPLPNAVAPKSS